MSDAKALVKENERLKKELADLSVLKVEQESLRGENARLRRILGLADATRAKWTVAKVLSRGGIAGVSQTMSVGAGSLAGVRENDVVMCPEGLVGRIGKVSLHTAEVILITDTSSHVSCIVETPAEQHGNVPGILSGEGCRIVNGLPAGHLIYVPNALKVRHLERNLELAPGQVVKTSGFGGVFPAGLLVGRLVSSGPGDSGLEREGEVAISADLWNLKEVLIRHVE
jgi:rod shape-determining protein MreC